VLFKYNMKIPKLKYYYLAMSETDYEEFARTRTIQPVRRTTLNPATGQMTTPFMYLYSRPATADTRYRQLNNYAHWPVYVLRIPREYVRRESLTPAPDPAGMWIYADPILLPFCGVERFELDPDHMPQVQSVIVASSKRNMISIPIT
jgi:hypothetical protein